MNRRFWQGKTVLVTGGTGFVGSHLVKELIQLGAKLIVFADRIEPKSIFALENLEPKVNFIKGYIEDFSKVENIFETYKINLVYHLAAASIESKIPHQIYQTNLKGTYNLLEAIRTTSNQLDGIIITSSEKVYGQKKAPPFIENFTLNAKEPYGVSKICSEYIALSYFYTFNLPIVIVRPSNIFGEGDLNFNHIIPYTILKLLKDEQIVLRSDGNSIRSFICVKDVIKAYTLLAEKLKCGKITGEAFNLSSKNCLKISEVVKKIISILGKNNSNVKFSNILDQDQYSSSEKIKKALDWQEQFSFEDSLKETIDWYKRFYRFF